MIVQFVGIPCAFLFGMLARSDRRQAIDRIGLVAYMAICVFGYFMTTATHFVVLAILVGAVQGGTQALSRSLFASLIPQGQVGRVLRLFRRRREIRGDPGAGRLHRRVKPQRDPGDHRVLRGGRSACCSSSTSPEGHATARADEAWAVPA